jgi:hypothetical protein
MSISNETVRATFAGNDSTTTFAIPFDFGGTDEIKVYLENAAGAITLKTEGASDGYDLTGNPVANVEMKVAPATDETLLLLRVNNKQQELDLINAGTFSAQSVEDQLDRTTRQVQEVDEQVKRAPRFKNTSSQADVTFPEPVADGLVKWNSDANALEALVINTDDALSVLLINDQTVGGQKTFTDKLVSTVDTAEDGIEINHAQNGTALTIDKTAGTGSALDIGSANFTVEQDGSFKAANEAFVVDANGIPQLTVEALLDHISTPGSAPAAGKLKVYSKSDDKLYTLDSASSEEALAYESYVATQIAAIDNPPILGAKIGLDGSTADIDDQGAENFIASVNKTGTGTVDITWTASYFTAAPVVVGSVVTDNSRNVSFTGVTNTGCTAYVRDLGGAFQNHDFDIVVVNMDN